jgi:hypothetical protein
MDAIVTVVLTVVGAVASWAQGKKSGVNNALSTAGDVVGMLSVKVGELERQLVEKEREIEKLGNLAGHCSTCQRQGSPKGDECTTPSPDTPNG